MEWVVLAAALALTVAGARIVWARPLYALYAFVVGLAFHNAVFLLLWIAGARGWQLTAAQAWKETLLAVALASVMRRCWQERRLPLEARPLDLALASLAAVALLYAVLPGSLLEGSASLQARAYGLRELYLPVACALLGRTLELRRDELVRLARLVLVTALAVSVVGLVEHYAVSLELWRDANASGYFTQQLGFPTLHGPAGLPENVALNTSEGVFRRLVSSFLSPLGTAYMLAVALLVAVAVRRLVRRPLLLAAGSALVAVAFYLAFARAATLALAGGLLLLGLVRRDRLAASLALPVLALGLLTGTVFSSVAPETRFFPEDLPWQIANAREQGGLDPGSPTETSLTLSDSSSREHLAELERGFRNFARHPQGYGLGASGQIAQRHGAEAQAGESLYLTVANETGVAGLVALLAVVAATLLELWRAARRTGEPLLRLAAGTLFAAQAAVFAIGLQTEVWGVPWLVYVLWTATGALIRSTSRPPPATSADP